MLLAAVGASAKYYPSAEVQKNRDAFAADRFGIFLHWGLYSTFAQGEWYMQNEDIDRDEYAKAADGFYPHNFDAREWVKAIKAAGARYITFTSRHHEGFSMWNTKQSDYNIMHTPYGKDIIKQLSKACQKEGIALHLYYSHLDWTRDDYPTGRTGLHTGKNPKKVDWAHYYQFMNAQLTELLTGYGPIRCIWFDGMWDRYLADHEAHGELWRLREQYDLIHSLQPACLVGNNHHRPVFEGEDIQIFEKDVPGQNTTGFSSESVVSDRLPLETCQTLRNSWGYQVNDEAVKTPEYLVKYLVRTAGKDANLLLNIGPRPDGTLPESSVESLLAMGKWLEKYGSTIYGTRGGCVPEQSWGATTQKGKELYVHVLDHADAILVPVKGNKLVSAVAFDGGAKVPFSQVPEGIVLTLPAKPEGCYDQIITLTFKNEL